MEEIKSALAALRTRRRAALAELGKIDAAIKALEVMEPAEKDAAVPDETPRIIHRPMHRPSDMMRKLVGILVSSPSERLSLPELYEGLEKAGYQFRSDDPAKNLSSVRMQIRRNDRKWVQPDRGMFKLGTRYTECLE